MTRIYSYFDYSGFSGTLKEMNDKLSQAVKLYDRLLSDQIMYRTRHVEPTGTSAQSESIYFYYSILQADVYLFQ